jgi:hypothetical protein
MIEIQEYVNSASRFRLQSSALGDWDDLIEICFNRFHWNEKYFTLHFHFAPYTMCTDEDKLNKTEWNNGVYFNGEERRFFAHFVRRLRSEPRGYYIRTPAMEPSLPQTNPSPEPWTPWTQPPLPTLNEQGEFEPSYPQAYDIPAATSSAPTPAAPAPTPRRRRAPQPALPRRVPPPAQPVPAVRRPTTQRRNTNSSTVYSLSPPLPSAHYPNSRYFSSSFTFVPIPPALPRLRTQAQQYRAPLSTRRIPAAVTAPAVPAYVIPARRQQRASGFTARPPPAVAPRRQPIVYEQIARPSPPSRDESGMDVDSDEQDIRLPPPSPSQNDNMDLYSDPHFDADGLGPPMERNTPAPWSSTEQRHNQEQESEEEEDLSLQPPSTQTQSTIADPRVRLKTTRRPLYLPHQHQPASSCTMRTRRGISKRRWRGRRMLSCRQHLTKTRTQRQRLSQDERTCAVLSSAPALDAC